MAEHKAFDPFNSYLQLSVAELEWHLQFGEPFVADDSGYLINPRRLRGSDFLMRWMQGRWSEDVVIKALNDSSQFGVLPYGPSTVAPEDPTELELFFEKMDVVTKEGKRPDLLLYAKPDFDWAEEQLIQKLGRVDKMAETGSESLREIITKAKAALEVENSLWVTERMPGFGKTFTRYIRGKNKGRLKSQGPVPTIIVKREDVPRLQKWQVEYGIPIYVVHIFFDRGYFIRFDDILSHLATGDIGWETQRFSNPDGTASTPKEIIKVPYILCQEFGLVSNPTLEPRTFVDKNGKVMTYVTFSGGMVSLASNVFETWGS